MFCLCLARVEFLPVPLSCRLSSRTLTLMVSSGDPPTLMLGLSDRSRSSTLELRTFHRLLRGSPDQASLLDPERRNDHDLLSPRTTPLTCCSPQTLRGRLDSRLGRLEDLHKPGVLQGLPLPVPHSQHLDVLLRGGTHLVPGGVFVTRTLWQQTVLSQYFCGFVCQVLLGQQQQRMKMRTMRRRTERMVASILISV